MPRKKKASRTGGTHKAGKIAKAKAGKGRTTARSAVKSKKASKRVSAKPAARPRYLPPDKEERGLERVRDEAGRENLHWERNRQIVLGEVAGKPS